LKIIAFYNLSKLFDIKSANYIGLNIVLRTYHRINTYQFTLSVLFLTFRHNKLQKIRIYIFINGTCSVRTESIFTVHYFWNSEKMGVWSTDRVYIWMDVCKLRLCSQLKITNKQCVKLGEEGFENK